ncbi:DUF6115 domain-containing protein [Ornithinibacillus scapharcae]|uniref:DUF6115 domain-containing protein n=1 Tax=Ornithinibacillus scapharcae TaxID=1147159 RepID=UPI000225AA24|nr:hypothetical protein [Ornithinibacillus scapharcae]
MTSFLFIISFLLHIVSIVAIYSLHKQRLQTHSTDTTKTSDIIELMDSYLEEIKQENRLLQEELSKNNNDSTNKENVTSKKNLDSVTRIEPTLDSKIDEEPLETIDINLNSDVQDEIEVSLQSRILKLYQEGRSIEDIARSLGCGKTEVELIVKFHEKK